jgi:uncharacterized protein YpmB
MRKSRRAQSTLEYIIVFTVIIAAVLVAANTMIRGRVTNMLDHVSNQAEKAVNHVTFE